MKHPYRIKTAVCGAIMTCVAIGAGAKDVEDATPTPAPILSTEVSASDLSCLTGAAHYMALLTIMSGMADKHAVTPEVKAEAAAVAEEQKPAMESLEMLAGKLNVPLDAELNGVDTDALASIGTQKGLKFDKAFLDAQRDAEDALGTALTDGLNSTDANIKEFAKTGLTRLKQEQDRMRKLGF